MNNSVVNTNRNELKELKSELAADTLVIEVDGAKICSWEDFWRLMSRAFSFPDLPQYMKPDYHSYYDMMTDLYWLKATKIALIIANSDMFLANDHALRDDIIKDFKDYLLPFWEKEVETTVLDGKSKEFNVFLSY